jgi:hypothetical protein
VVPEIVCCDAWQVGHPLLSSSLRVETRRLITIAVLFVVMSLILMITPFSSCASRPERMFHFLLSWRCGQDGLDHIGALCPRLLIQVQRHLIDKQSNNHPQRTSHKERIITKSNTSQNPSRLQDFSCKGLIPLPRDGCKSGSNL